MISDNIITHSELSTALVNRLDLQAADADDLAIRILSLFGYGSEIIDNALTVDDRRVFYFLQDLGLLSTRWEEATLVGGKAWRVFYWQLNGREIAGAARRREEEMPSSDVYACLPDDAWARQEA